MSIIKDTTQFVELYNVVYHSICDAENCKESYIGESVQLLNKMIKDYTGWNCNYRFLKHSIESGHKPFWKVFQNYRRRLQEQCFWDEVS